MAALVIDSKNGINLVTSIGSTTEQYHLRAAKTSLPVKSSTTTTTNPRVTSSSNSMMNSDKLTTNHQSNHESNSANKAGGEISSLQSIEQTISESSKQKISSILTDVEKLTDAEKLFLYLQLPDGTSPGDDSESKKKCLNNLFGKKADNEVIQTYTWIQSHLEEDISVSIPKHEVYDEYRAYCEANKFEKLCVADFGKAMKHIFPQVKPRRLGQRGNSKYCYSGLRKKVMVDAPELPVLDTSEYRYRGEERENNLRKNVLVDEIVSNVILEWAEKTFTRKFKSSMDFARHLIETQNIKADLANAFKNSECKNSAEKNGLPPRTSSAKKKDVCNHISKRLLEKKKSDSKIGDNRFSPLTSRAAKQQQQQPVNNINKSTVKQTDNTDKVNKPPMLAENLVFASQNLKLVSKMPLASNTSNIILISGTQTLPKESLSSNTAITGCKPGATKYKPIQPKPINLPNHAYQEEENVCFAPNSLSTLADKRRHSVTSIFSADTVNNCDANIKKEFDDLASELKITNSQDSDKNYKRQMEEKDFQFMTKKRHVENICQGQVDHAANGSPHLDSSDLKVNEIETEALYEYLSTNVSSFETVNNNNNGEQKESIGQIRKLLQNNLTPANLNNNVANFAPTVNPNQPAVAKSQFSFDNSLLCNYLTKDSNTIANLPNRQVPIPPSPNSRRNAFSFQPISPRTTPVIPENATLDVYLLPKAANNGFNGQYKQMNTVSVGPSQPPSEANSPFVSPRNTPIPTGPSSRSRNNSGQSQYSNFRQTPLQSFDSGVSSISSSPFISPQTTPIPATRIRSIDNGNISRNFARVRHSSGPGGPVNRSQVSNVMLYNRSNSLSPMIGENLFTNSQPFNQTLLSNALNENGAEESGKLFNEDLMNKLNIVNQSDEQEKNSLLVMAGLDSAQLQMATNPAKLRQRHFSNPYGAATMVKNENEESNSIKALLNRSHSVPLHQMFDSSMFDSAPLGSQLNDFTTGTQVNAFMPMMRGEDGGKQFSDNTITSEAFELSQANNPTGNGANRSATIQTNEMISSSLDDILNNNDSLIQSGQDLIVSSVQLNPGISATSNGESNQHSTVEDLNVNSPLLMTKSDSDELNDLLIGDSEHFPTIDEFRDCDNDFSNIALENTTNSYDDYIKFN